jgi:hypothetical protein
MNSVRRVISAALVMGAAGASLSAQTVPSPSPTPAAQKESRYQIGVMERVLEGAVEHGVTNIRDRLQTLGPTELLIADNARARGFRLDGYGVFFDVLVPSFDTTVLWAARTLDQNDLGLTSALKALQENVQRSGDPSLEQALRRVEIQINPGGAVAGATRGGTASGAENPVTLIAPQPNGAPAASSERIVTASSVDEARTPAPPARPDTILSSASLDEAYRKEVVNALMDVMLEHSSALAIAPNEWLTVAARRNEERPRLAPADTDSRTIVIRLKGADLAAFLARQISKDDVVKQFDVRVF